jgi:hypothetical protein
MTLTSRAKAAELDLVGLELRRQPLEAVAPRGNDPDRRARYLG